MDIKLKIPDTDYRDYRYIILENEAHVLLISDKDTDKEAACCDVNIGSFCDPENLPGLAHFLEHMLFMGSEKYPDENAFDKYVSEHGGSTNAFTLNESTNYYFDVTKGHLKGALDIFAQFFIAPLMLRNATEREIKAVNNEHKRNLQVDSWRLAQLLRTHANPAHPFHKFATGSLETLSTEPKKQNIDVREELVAFHTRYYSSNLMRFTILGHEPLDVLEQWAREILSPIKNKKIPRPTWNDPRPFLPNQLGRVLKMVPVKDKRSIKFHWPIPAQWRHYREKAAAYCEHLLGHEGDGSLFALLKKKGWATSLVAGASDTTSNFEIFKVSITLTELGFAHRDDVVLYTFQYIEMMRRAGPQEWIWRESAQISETEFRFLSKKRPINFVCDLANNMQWYEPQDAVSGPWLYEVYNAKMIEDVMNCLTPENLLLCYISQEYKQEATLVEKWYGTRYSYEPIDPKLLERIKSITDIDPKLYLPSPNEFIPTALSLKEPTNEEKQTLKSHTETHGPALIVSKIPTLLKETSLSKVWHLFNVSYKQPKAVIHINLVSTEAYTSPHNAVMTELISLLVHDAVNEYAYNAKLAGLSYELNFKTTGLEIMGWGFDHKLPLLLTKFLDKLIHLEVAEDRFKVNKEKLLKDYRNHTKEAAHVHARYYAGLALVTPKWSYKEKIEALQDITRDDVQHFIKTLLNSLLLEWFIHGNILSSEAEKLVADVESMFRSKQLVIPAPSVQRFVKLRKGAEFVCQLREPNPDELNSAVCNVYQIGHYDDLKLAAQCHLLDEMLSEPAFDQLRTKEQLGYIVWTGLKHICDVQIWRVVVQSSDYDAKYLNERVEAFIKDAEILLSEMSDEDFASYVDSVIALKLEKPHSLKALSRRIWSEIANRRYVFNRCELEVEVLRKTTKDDILALFRRFILNEKTRRKLTVQVFSSKHKLPDGQLGDGYVKISDFARFKESMPLFPRFLSDTSNEI